MTAKPTRTLTNLSFSHAATTARALRTTILKQRLVVLFAGLVLAAYLGIVGATLLRERGALADVAQRQALMDSRLIEALVSQQIDGVARVLEAFAATTAKRLRDPNIGESLGEAARDLIAPEIAGLAAINPIGERLVGDPDLAEQIFRLPAASAPEILRTGGPFTDRTGKQLLVFARPVLYGGTVLGTAGARVDPARLTQLVAIPDLDASGQSYLLTDSGTILASWPPQPEIIGQFLPPWGDVHRVAEIRASGTIDLPAVLIGWQRLRNTDLLIVTCRSWRDVFRGWTRTAVIFGGGAGGGAMAAFGLLIVALVRSVRQAEAETARRIAEAAQEELKRIAATDPLTGAVNRRGFLERIESELTRARRHRNSLSVITFDLDYFKSINDRFGHAAGDAALVAFVDRAKGALRQEDVLGRMGGEEFVALLPMTARDGAGLAADRVRRAIGEIVLPMAGGQTLCFTVSCGVAELSGHDSNVDDLLVRADVALYRAKEGGRNRVEIA